MSGLANLSNSHSLEVALPQETDVAPPLATESNRADAALLRRIDLTTLRLFLAIYEERNLTRAAAREGIAASAVSKRMNDFELACGVTLFTRMSKGMALTAAGEALLHHARVTLLNVEKIAAELGEYARGIRGHVRMLANLSAIVQFLPEDLSRFFDAHEALAHRPAGAAERAGGAGDRGGRRRDRHLLERDRDARLRDVSLSLRQSGHGDARGSSARRVRDALIRRHARLRPRRPACVELDLSALAICRGASGQVDPPSHPCAGLRCGLPHGAGQYGS